SFYSDFTQKSGCACFIARAPNGPIYLVMRLYSPKLGPPPLLPPGSGTWQPPAIEISNWGGPSARYLCRRGIDGVGEAEILRGPGLAGSGAEGHRVLGALDLLERRATGGREHGLNRLLPPVQALGQGSERFLPATGALST